MTALPLADAARELGVSAATLKRWIRAGAPVARRGRRGRGHAMLIDVGEVRRWRGADDHERALQQFANQLPELLAEAFAEAHRLTDGPVKRPAAGVLAGCWYIAATMLLDHLRAQAVDVPEVATVPEAIDRLRKIARE